MPFVFGFLAGEMFCRIAFSRVALTAAFWMVVSAVGYRVGANNVSPFAGSVLSVGLPLGVMGWALHHPAASRLAIWLCEGLLVVTFLGMLASGLVVVLALEGGIGDHSNMTAAAMAAPLAAFLWGVRWLVLHRLRRSDEMLGERSLLRT